MADFVQTTYRAGYSDGSKPSVVDMITNISPDDTVVCAAIGKTKATNKYHEWPTDVLEAPQANAQIEGGDIDATDVAPPSMESNYTQILAKSVRISDHREKEGKYGRKSEIKYQSANKLKELATDFEFAVVNNTVENAGTKTVARQMKGIAGWITTNTYDFGAAKAVTNLLTEDLLNDSMQSCWTQGGKVDLVVVPPNVKRQISKFDGYDTLVRNINTNDKKVSAVVNFYEGDFGDVAIKAHRYITETEDTGSFYGSAYILDTATWKRALFCDVKKDKLGKTGLSEKYLMSMEATLEARAEQGNAKIDNLFLR